MTYTRTIPIEFNHCDPAGIVFYPRYFEMTNSVCENFFADRIGRSYGAMMAAGEGLPTAAIRADFRAPSRLGDKLDWTLTVERIGRTSVTVVLYASCAGEDRVEVEKTLVWIGENKRPAPWPEAMRAKLEEEEE